MFPFFTLAVVLHLRPYFISKLRGFSTANKGAKRAPKCGEDNKPWKLGGHSSLGWEWPLPLWPPRFKMSPIPFQSGDFLAGGGLKNRPTCTRNGSKTGPPPPSICGHPPNRPVDVTFAPDRQVGRGVPLLPGQIFPEEDQRQWVNSQWGANPKVRSKGCQRSG